jgi:hypothetical protein
MHLFERTDQRVESPFQVQKLIQINLVTVLYVLVIQLTVRKNMVHVVFWAPPLQTESPCNPCGQSTILHEPWMAVVGHRVTDPARDHLGKGEK